MVVGAADRVVAVNAAARNLFPALRPDGFAGAQSAGAGCP